MAEQKTYPTAQAAVEDLRPGWKIVGQQPHYRTVPASSTDPNAVPLPGDPTQKAIQDGVEYSIQSPSGQPDKVVLGDAENTYVWNTTPGAPLPKALVVLSGGSATPSQGDKKPSDPSKWLPVTGRDANGQPTSQVIGQWDPVNNELHAQSAPTRTPTGQYVPVTVTNANGTTEQIGYVDTGDPSQFRAMPTEKALKPSGKYTDEFVTDASGKQKLVAKVDTGDHSWHPVSIDPASQKRLIQTPTAVYSVDDQDKVAKLFDVDQNTPYQLQVIDGVSYRFDPHEKDPTKALVKIADAPLPQQIKDSDGNTMILSTDADGNGKYVYPPGVQRSGTLQTNTTAKTLNWYDGQGNLIKSVPNENYVAPQNTVNPPAVNTVAPRILIPDPDHPGQLKWIDNEGRVTASQALQQLASQLSGHVVDSNISVDEAKALIDAANQAMTAQANAANTALDYTSRSAQTGAGLLQQRAASAQGILSDVMRTATARPLYAGAPDVSGMGSAIAGYTADLFGGQDTLNAAANMVKAANPQAPGPMQAAATAALTQILMKRQELTGELHPTEQAQAAARQSVQQNAVVAPNPVIQPVQPQGLPATWQRADQMYGTTPSGDALAQPGMAGTVPPGSPQYLGFKAPFEQSDLSEGRSVVPSVQASPMPGFVAPTAQVRPPAPTVNLYIGAQA